MTIPGLPSTNDPYARTTQVFPVLESEMVDRIRNFGNPETIEAGTVLFVRGSRLADFFVVLDGEIGIYRAGDRGAPVEQVLTVFSTGQFTGELDHLRAQAPLVSARAITKARVLRVPAADVRRLMAAEPDIAEIMMRAFILRRMGVVHNGDAAITLLGAASSVDTLRIERFVVRNGYPLRLADAEGDPLAVAMAVELGLEAADLPAVITVDNCILRNPTIPFLADRLGLAEKFDPEECWDVAVIGAGPAGLAAGTYAASEGLKTVVIEGLAPGGQAGTSSHIENYLGFPSGISGQALAARAQIQAQKFGARIAVSRAVIGLESASAPFRLALEDGQIVTASALVIASGARYRRLSVPGYDRFEGAGVHYAATAMEAALCTGQTVVIVGGGNSAGQAAVFLSRNGGHVHILVRQAGLAATMSEYLVDRIARSQRISLHVFSEITSLTGDKSLCEVEWTDVRNQKRSRISCGALFVMIGAEPNSGWLRGRLPLDGKGFVLTGCDAAGQPLASPYATALPGIYAVGDVRAGSVKRVASGVGEGSVVIQDIHRFLGAMK